MDISLLDESPPGRERDRVETVVMPNTRRDEVVARIKDACAAGRRVYWVCPIIDESETLEVEAATARYETLSRDLPDLRIALIHGRTPSDEKASTMTSFRAGGIDLLVATTIIEVGVDVPEASLMIIENSERLGLSQLHQLRGRVGRGEERACCVLMYQAPLGDLAKERLRVMRDSHSGFEIAERDLALRGPGDLMGTRQSGVRQFHIANLARDRALLPDVVRTADALIEAEPSLVAGLVRRWIRAGMDYSHV
jgi:ATP-dependent DNA helicase RecG